MALRSIARHLSLSAPSSSSSSSSPFLRWASAYSSGSKVLNEEEKAAENIYIKKMEQEKLEKLATKGLHPDKNASSVVTSGEVITQARDSEPIGDNTKNIAFASAVVAAITGGWLIWSFVGKKEEKDKD